MKHPIVPLALVSLVLCGCANPTASPSGVPNTTPSPSPSSAASPTPSPTIVTNAACNEIAFYLDPILATGYTCETWAADPGPMNPHPALTRITLVGYSPSATNPNSPQIFVMSVSDYTATGPTTFATSLADLQGLIGASSPPVYGISAPTPMPVLPDTGGIPGPFAQFGWVSFADGDGVRFITQKSFDAVPLGNDQTFYTFQGLTADNQYWVSAILPIQHSILPATVNDPPVGMTWDQFWADYDNYMTTTVNQLNGQPPDTFDPPIGLLDALISSIVFVP